MIALLSFSLSALATTNLSPAPPVSKAKTELAPLRGTAVGAVVGWSHSGLAIRHFWMPNFASGLAAYASFGQRFGAYSVSARSLYSYALFPEFHLYAVAPIHWSYSLEPTHREFNFGPDPLVNRIHKLRLGVGPGMELFMGPHVSVVVELPVALQWSWSTLAPPVASSPPHFSYVGVPNAGVYVYFR